jgi:UbiD family decarboxylase
LTFRDLREFVLKLKAEGELLEVEKEVDLNYELGDICKVLHDEPSPKAIIFNRIKHYSGWKVVCNVLGSYRRVSMALGGVPVETLTEHYLKCIDKPAPPIEIPRQEAPCKEVVLKGDEASFAKLPIPIWHPDDGGPYITLGVQVCRNPQTAASNLAILRQMILGSREASLNALPGKRTYIFYKQLEEKNEPLELAIVIGVEPAIQIAACHSAKSLDEDEYGIAGALKGEPIEVVKCETIDVMVPARAEIVIEGVVPPNERVLDGKFGEFTGYMAGVRQNPKFEVTCITHRSQPIFQATYEGRPPVEDHIFKAIPYSAAIQKTASNTCPGITGVWLTPAGGTMLWGVVRLKKMYPGHAKHAMNAIWSTHIGKYVKFLVVVDDDVNIYNADSVIWAISMRVQPDRDLVLESRSTCIQLDPSAWPLGITSKLGIDATEKLPEEGGPPPELKPKLINHSKSHYWQEICNLGLLKYLGIKN